MFKEFVDEHNIKATRKANQFTEEKNVEVKSFTAFADNLAKTHLIVEFNDANEEEPVAPATKKPAAKTATKRTSTKSAIASK
ncbi:MAG: hypothetical protein HOU59_gp68 (endogenous virus) [Lactobacillus phage ViSo-2018a]|uniref:Uncharacterized protein n=1 Tax=Lactobacillus phage ViSo-2018a TaxID=2267607 RepID=A0A3G6JH25_9CAUD|nr:MAG: hypothetical protein HOU59_gp68 [Lactobacillus phage ViSo-2018a]AZA17322.1 MAG: hypothetical protein DQL93_0715 [Lactobacillus phage ViSo-2018a]